MRLARARQHGCLALATLVVAGIVAACLWAASLDLRPGTWLDTVAFDELRPGEPVRADLEGVPLFITRIRDDAVYAVVAVDPHPEGCEIRWDAEGQQFYDGCLGSMYEADGSYVRGPAARGLDSYPTSLRGGTVQINLEALTKGVTLE